jgi:hypothetical protein
MAGQEYLEAEQCMRQQGFNDGRLNQSDHQKPHSYAKLPVPPGL